jgi:Tfp pilus assembly protein PilF
MRILAILFSTVIVWAQAKGPEYVPLAKAYAALHARDYDTAVANFEKAIAAAPARASIRKDFAYTLLKIGENEEARKQFAAAMRLDPGDSRVALEYAFLCYEQQRQAEARRIFDRLRKTGDPASRATAEQAFENIDRPLAEGIARWSKAVELSPASFSAHQELARLADQRDEYALAAENYEKAWRLKPSDRELLLDLGRVWKALGRDEASNAALLAASRGAEPRVAERARELLPQRYPYVYEFRDALKLDPNNLGLHRELAYLLLAMGRKKEAEVEFRTIVHSAPDDLLSAAQLGFLLLARHDAADAAPLLDRVLKNDDGELGDKVRSELGLPQALKRRPEAPAGDPGGEARFLAEKSLKAGYLKDALKYLRIAHESDPLDFAVMLQLGWTYNILRQDDEAIRWFDLASKSPNTAISGEARKAYNNLHPEFARFRTSAWLFPFYSSRWKDVFAYGQVKTDLRLGRLPFRPYVSVRFVGDTRGAISSDMPGIQPQYLSESSFIVGLGIASSVWRGLMGWAEAGEAMRYAGTAPNQGSMVPDYRGGLSFSRGWGHLLTPTSHGFFAATSDDGVFVSRFQNDMILYLQNRTGYTFRSTETIGFHTQLYWNWNLTADREGQYWANYGESGPGIRFRFNGLPQSMLFTVDLLHGSYLVNAGNPRGPTFNDLRAGFWYAFTH